MKKKKSKIAALQKSVLDPHKLEDEIAIELGYILKSVSECCGASVRERPRKSGTLIVILCKGCHYETRIVRKITRANLIPAYGRRPVTTTEVLDWFYRGMDYQLSPCNRYTSVRDMAQGAILQIRFGKRLQKVMSHIVELANMK